MLARFVPMLASSAVGSIGPMLRRAKRNAAMYVLCVLFLLGAFAAAVTALGIWIAQHTGALEAALIVCGALVALAAAMMLLVMLLNWLDRRRHGHVDRSRAITTMAAVSALPIIMRSRPLMLTTAVGGLAFVALMAMKNRDQR